MVLTDTDAVLGDEIPRPQCREIEAKELNLNTKELGDIILNCNIRGFRSNVESLRELK